MGRWSDTAGTVQPNWQRNFQKKTKQNIANEGTPHIVFITKQAVNAGLAQLRRRGNTQPLHSLSET